MNLRVIVDGPAAGEGNMASDLLLATSLDRGEAPPTLRLYGWDPPAVSIGYHQDQGDLDGDRLSSAGIHLVRRPTGGGAILHWQELTYAVALPLTAGSPRDLYRAVHGALLAGVRRLGIDAELGDPAEGRRVARGPSAGVACFSTAATSEIHAGGKKLVGSAQRKLGGVILQHGSFLLGPRHLRITEFIRADRRGTAAADLASGATDAETVLGRPVDFGEAAAAVLEGFSRGPFTADPVPSNGPEFAGATPHGR